MGAPWEDLPARYGAVGTVSSRFYRWRKAGVFDRVLQRLSASMGTAIRWARDRERSPAVVRLTLRSTGRPTEARAPRA